LSITSIGLYTPIGFGAGGRFNPNSLIFNSMSCFIADLFQLCEDTEILDEGQRKKCLYAFTPLRLYAICAFMPLRL
jgi:hypothetical protein